MCLNVKWYSIKRKAKEDIECFKVLRRVDSTSRLVTWCRDYPVTIGEEMVAKTLKKEYWASYRQKWRVEVGIHTVKTKDEALKVIAHSGFFRSAIIVRCIIPKGTEYYKGKWPADMYDRVLLDSYASKSLIIKEIVE